MKAGSATPARRKPTARSRIGNGSAILPTTDGRSLWARIMRDTFEALLEHCGGPGYVSDTQRLACRRVATLEAELIYLEDKFAQKRANGDAPSPTDLDLYGRLADRQRRLADPLGWKRTACDVVPKLQDIIDGEAPSANGGGR